jgi:methylenetetrahydrofolate reductase (NADPH)
MFTDEGAVDAFLRQLREAGADQVFLIAGDLARPAGVLESALQLIKSSVLVENGVHEIGIAGYPEGHPELPENELDISLAEKINAAEKLGVTVHIATQFCFHAAQIATWVQRVRGMGFRNRIRIGIAGPSRISTLLAYAANFGVPTSEKELQRGGSASEGFWTPKALLKELSDEFGKHDPGEVSLHLFAFGGLPNSARWLVNLASGA